MSKDKLKSASKLHATLLFTAKLQDFFPGNNFVKREWANKKAALLNLI